jgi:uncharacterized protein GlcG (DUF336 family)
MKRKYVITAAAIAIAAGTAIAIGAGTANGAPGAQPPSASSSAVGTSHFLPLAQARKAADAAMAACVAKGYPVSVTVVDRDGVVIDQERADTATGATVGVSQQKAYAAIGFQVPTEQLQELAKTQPGFVYINGFSILPGGLPISGGGALIAGIGVSGAPTGFIDADCANSGIKAIS